ncbi:hypothetical protein RJ55_01465 [Drechmeria coniospora]|nr:hypothetical protein RJ55_01465 [Drechmeria coniospora]
MQLQFLRRRLPERRCSPCTSATLVGLTPVQSLGSGIASPFAKSLAPRRPSRAPALHLHPTQSSGSSAADQTIRLAPLVPPSPPPPLLRGSVKEGRPLNRCHHTTATPRSQTQTQSPTQSQSQSPTQTQTQARSQSQTQTQTQTQSRSQVAVAVAIAVPPPSAQSSTRTRTRTHRT